MSISNQSTVNRNIYIEGFGKKYSRRSRSIMQPHHGEGLFPRPHCPHASLKYPLIPIYTLRFFVTNVILTYVIYEREYKGSFCNIYERIKNENCVLYKQLHATE